MSEESNQQRRPRPAVRGQPPSPARRPAGGK